MNAEYAGDRGSSVIIWKKERLRGAESAPRCTHCSLHTCHPDFWSLLQVQRQACGLTQWPGVCVSVPVIVFSSNQKAPVACPLICSFALYGHWILA